MPAFSLMPSTVIVATVTITVPLKKERTDIEEQK